ncbi:MAG: hypothetical protein NC818_07125, partial [Candidatus Omnitrophica bacterium]|nr:hypothetical protein [Candidatus Omnitrophota bacterium]
FEYEIDWGDGKRESDILSFSDKRKSIPKPSIIIERKEEKEEPLEFRLQHTYIQEGNYNINLLVSSFLREGKLASVPLVIPVQVKVKPPLIEFIRQGIQGEGANQQEFFIKTKQGSLTIKKWELDFGNGEKRDGVGEIEKSFVANYSPNRGKEDKYRAVFSVTTTDDKIYTKELLFRVTGVSSAEGVPSVIDTSGTTLKPVSPTGPAGLLQQEGIQPQKAEQIDLAIEKINLASELFLGEKTSIGIEVKNNSSSGVENILVKLKSDDGFEEPKEINIKPQSTQIIEFLWTPQKLGKQKITASLDYRDYNFKNNVLIQYAEVKQKETKSVEERKEDELLDLSLERIETPQNIFVNERTEIVVYLRNNSKEAIKDCLVFFETEDGFKDKRPISLGPNKLEKVIFAWNPKQLGKQKTTTFIEYKDDSNPKNNQLTQRIEVKSKEQEEEKPTLKIIRIILEGERQETLPIGLPLALILEIDSSAEIDFKEPIEVNISLKGKEFQENFREKITQLRKGRNKIRFELLDELKPDKYILRLELSHPEYKIRIKEEKNFVVVEEER